MDASPLTSTPTATTRCDVLVVGAGIVGLAHAAEAAERGLSVIVIERDSRAVGASIRNFGHCCVTAQSGDLLELALVARERWLHFAALAGFFAVESGALAVARSATELELVEQLARSRPAGQVVMMSAEEIQHELGGSEAGLILGGARLRDDLRVDPREAVAALAHWLEAQPNVQIRWRTSYLGREDTAISGPADDGPTDGGATGGTAVGTESHSISRTSRGSIQADRTIVCVGHDVDYLFPAIAEHYEIERCSLQMLMVAAPTIATPPATTTATQSTPAVELATGTAPAPVRIRPAVLTGTSMLRYPAFAETSAGKAISQRLAAEFAEHDPDLLAIGANVMFTQRPNGALLVGDSHHYAATVGPFLTEATSAILLERIASVLGAGEFEVLERWQGIYASSSKQPYVVVEPSAGLTVVSVTSGVGMTIAFGLARRVFEQLSENNGG